jgi:molecular chaperone GrpE
MKDKKKRPEEEEVKVDESAELSKAKTDCEHWKNEYYRAYADIANLRKEIEKDHKESIKYRIEGFVSELLNVLDAFDMALRNEPSSPEMKNYLIGFQYVYKQLNTILENEGVQIVEPKVGDKFDETVMHAVETCEDEGEENLVKSISLKGYKLHDHLVRPAYVIVTKHPEVKEENTENKEENEEKAPESAEMEA